MVHKRSKIKISQDHWLWGDEYQLEGWHNRQQEACWDTGGGVQGGD